MNLFFFFFLKSLTCPKQCPKLGPDFQQCPKGLTSVLSALCACPKQCPKVAPDFQQCPKRAPGAFQCPKPKKKILEKKDSSSKNESFFLFFLKSLTCPKQCPKLGPDFQQCPKGLTSVLSALSEHLVPFSVLSVPPGFSRALRYHLVCCSALRYHLVFRSVLSPQGTARCALRAL